MPPCPQASTRIFVTPGGTIQIPPLVNTLGDSNIVGVEEFGSSEGITFPKLLATAVLFGTEVIGTMLNSNMLKKILA